LLFVGWVLGPQTVAQGDADPAVVGEWSAALQWPQVAVHMQCLPTGKVMFYPYSDDAHSFDPATNNVVALPNVGYNPFCSAHAFLPDGRLLITGGHHIDNGWGEPFASIYDPFQNSWTRVENMNDGRWYPSNVSLANGHVLVLSGSSDVNFTNNRLPQVWTGAGWRDLVGAEKSLPLFPDLHLAPNGKVFLSGPAQSTHYLDTEGSGSWSFVANRRFPDRNYCNSVLYGDGKVLFVGGGNPPTASAEVIDLNGPNSQWRTVGSMSIQRRQINSTLLPDGSVLVTGGVSGEGFNNMETPVFRAEIWDPVSENFTTLASMSVPRWYHSTTVLLPDGRVLSAGGDDNPSAELYSPPYLFRGPRPTISSSLEWVGYGQAFFVETPDAFRIAHVNWIRVSAVTHATNMDQRILRLSFSQTPGGLNVTAPSSASACPPGYYMLFLLSTDSVGQVVPSVAAGIRISVDAPEGPPLAPINVVASPRSTSEVEVSWEFASGNESGFKVERLAVGEWEEIVIGGIATSFTDTGLTAATVYSYRMRASSGAGNSSYSNTANAMTLASRFLHGDCNNDSEVDLSDAVCLLGHLFQSNPELLPCNTAAANLAVMDCNNDGSIDLSDAIYKLSFLFLGGPPPAQGVGCIAIPDCPENPGC
jgi:hypothetical protein